MLHTLSQSRAGFISYRPVLRTFNRKSGFMDCSSVAPVHAVSSLEVGLHGPTPVVCEDRLTQRVQLYLQALVLNTS